MFGFPYFGNPASAWPAFEERLAQLRPLDGYGAWDVPLNLLRYLGWSGDQGVQLFLIVSGFGLTWGLLARKQAGPLPLPAFYARRAERVFPEWWGAHILFLGTWIFLGAGLSFSDGKFLASLLGVRVTRELFYFFAPAWWYVGLLLQLYLFYPLLWEGLRRRGPLWLFVVVGIVSFVIRGVGLLYFDRYLDAWSRGAIFITRLPEFVAGMCLAAWLQRAPERTDAVLRKRSVLLLAVVAYVAGTALSFTLAGMTVAPFLVGAAAFVLLYAVFRRPDDAPSHVARPFLWIGRHSFALYLVHDPIVRACVTAQSSGARALFGVFLAAFLSVAAAWFLESAARRATHAIAAWWRRGSLLGVAWRTGLILSLAGGMLLGGEFAVRRFDPQEIEGWGERPSLLADSRFGWRLRPAQVTHLRWEGYDYTVTANSLGFPGPEYPVEKGPGTLRVFALGDAFTSAEGVDTRQAWPRLLEEALRKAMPTRRIEVMNFAITGYGPEQTAAVVNAFVPLYRPDHIVYGFFVNEYLDVLASNEQFRASIGFGRDPADGWNSVRRLSHLRRYFELKLGEPLAEVVRGIPARRGYFLGNFAALERETKEMVVTGKARVQDRLGQIREIARAVDAQVIIAMIPAPVQVCGPGDLDYFPRHVDLGDRKRYDPDQPQDLTRAMAEAFGIRFLDLREALRNSPEGCPFHRDNMHFTGTGHRLVAAHLADRLLSDRIDR